MEISRWCVRFRVRARAVKGKVRDGRDVNRRYASSAVSALAQCYP